jgi:hypothetical protein
VSATDNFKCEGPLTPAVADGVTDAQHGNDNLTCRISEMDNALSVPFSGTKKILLKTFSSRSLERGTAGFIFKYMKLLV